jgi:general secretion pathway protein B
MSYILDALKKADAERERGTIPGLHSQPLAPAPDRDGDDDHPRESRGAAQKSPLVWVGVGVAACLIGVLTVAWLMHDSAEPAASNSATGQQVGQAPPPAPTGAVMPGDDGRMPQQAAEAPPMQPPMTQQMPGQDASANTQQSTAPWPAPAAPQGSARARTKPRDMAGDSTAAAPANRGAGGVAQPKANDVNIGNNGVNQGTTAGRLPTFNELPEEVRREIPALSIGGAMYSEAAASRMLVINGQVFHEGEQPYQGLVLEEIRLKTAVFRFRGTRYSVSFRD